MALFSAGSTSSLTYHLAPFVLDVMTTSLPSILPLVAFPKGLFSALYSSSCTPHLSAPLSLLFPSTTTFTQIILSSSSLFTHSTSTQPFLTFKTLFNTSLPGWLLIFLLLTPLRLNCCSSDSKPTCQNTQLFTRHLPLCSKPWLHLWRTSYFHWPNYCSLQSLLLSHSSTSLYTAIPWFVNCLYHCYLYRSLHTWLL